jgi:hypothetical protein
VVFKVKTAVKGYIYSGFYLKNRCKCYLAAVVYKNRCKQFAAVFNKTAVKLCSAPNNSGCTTAANWGNNRCKSLFVV